MSNSNLVNYTKLSPNHSTGRKHEIDTITIHMAGGQSSVEGLGSVFAKESRQASSNYGVGNDGRIGMYVEEKHRSWCSGGVDKNGNAIRVNGISGADNDHRAITIEVASDAEKPYAVNDAAYKSLIRLLVDICIRNNIRKLLWKGDKSLVGKVDQQNMTVHKWFSDTSCPGDYLMGKMADIANRVNRILSGETESAVLNEIGNEVKTVTIEMQVLKKGAKGEQVKTLQRLLKSYGYKDQNGDSLAIDGSFGGKTDYAVRAYQTRNNLEVDGSVGKATWSSILKAVLK